MAFRLKLRESLPDGLKRVFCEEIDAALQLCQNPAKQRGVTVHEVRKHLKKLRAAIEDGDRQTAQTLLPQTVSLIDKSVQKGILHSNAAARYKSRLTMTVSSMTA